MLQYTLRRVLLMVPVFFLISLLVFLLLNLAPGRPGERGGAENGQSGKTEVTSESVMLFKQQFSLDKPILFNTRSWMDQAEVRQLLSDAYGLEGNPLPAARVAAREALEDFGTYLVRHQVALILQDSNPDLRRAAADTLVLSAKKAMVSESAADAEVVTRANREIDTFNREFRGWKCEATEEVAPCLERITPLWKGWWESNHADYEYEGTEKLYSFFLDTRFATYWYKLLHLDLGISVVNHEPVLPQLVGRIKYSISLSLLSILLAYSLAVPLGVYSAVRPGSTADTVSTVGLFVLYSLPTFFTGTVLLKLLSQGTPLEIFPTGGFYNSDDPPQTTLGQLLDILWHIAMPVATSTSVALAALSRYARTGVIDVIRADYIRTARAKGLSEPVVIIKHAVRNGMIPILTLLGGLLPVLVSGSVVIEVVFNIPGMGTFLIDAINQRDYNVVMAVLLASSLLTQVGILISDLSYALVDPRISLD